jgi:hypothetical protein
MYPNWTWWHTGAVAALALFVGATAAFGWFIDSNNAQSTLWLWAILALMIVAFVFVVGQGITGRYLGILIDQNYKMQLARLQLLAWTVLIISALLTAVFWNLNVQGDTTPLNITIPAAVWGLLGISVASTAGTQLIHGQKAQRQASDADRIARLSRISSRRAGASLASSNPALGVAAAATASNVASLKEQYRARQASLRAVQVTPPPADPAAVQTSLQAALTSAESASAQLETSIQAASADLGVRTNGLLAANATIDNATPAELFTGDDVGNDDTVDVGKVQMFLFTLALLVGYGASIAATFTGAGRGAIAGLPAVDPGMLTLLGVSQAGYLANTAAPHPAPDL